MPIYIGTNQRRADPKRTTDRLALDMEQLPADKPRYFWGLNRSTPATPSRAVLLLVTLPRTNEALVKRVTYSTG